MAILSVHLADVGGRAAPGILRRRPVPHDVPGLRYAELAGGAPIAAGVVPRPTPSRVGLIASWDDDSALDGFLATHPLAERLAGGWHVRLEPLRVVGSWSGLPDLPAEELPIADDEPVAVLTLGRLRLRRLLPFLRANSPAAGQAASDSSMVFATALARPPRIVATFSLWRTAAGMRAYALGRSGGGHLSATRAHAARPFHHESAFVRFRPYAAQGTWEGREPLSELTAVGAPEHAAPVGPEAV